MRAQWLGVAVGLLLLGGVAWWMMAGLTRTATSPDGVVPEPPAVGVVPVSTPPPLPAPAATPPGTEEDFRAEWTGVREAVLAQEPDAMARLRTLTKRWSGLEPVPAELREARSLTHLMSVEDAARALR